MSFFKSAVVQVIREHCHCHFWAAFISEGVLFCDEAAPTQTVFRANISSFEQYSSRQLIGFIQDWVSKGGNITSGIHFVTFDPSCPVRVDSTNRPCAGQKALPSFTVTNISLMVLGFAIFFAFLVVAILSGTALLCTRKRYVLAIIKNGVISIYIVTL